jgi:hypothetical protein
MNSSQDHITENDGLASRRREQKAFAKSTHAP